MSSVAAPRIRRTAQNTQFTYNLSRRVHDTQTYPVQSPQGATILIYGHENGVTLVWRGGRRFKPSKKTPVKEREKQNGATEDAVMVIDSDDDEPPAKASMSKFEDKPEFEDDVEDTPYPEIIQTLELSLGTAVRHVAVMPMTPCAADDAAWGGAQILTDRMVFAVSCATNDAYAITLPLTPPSPESKARPELKRDLLAGKAGSGAWGESLILLTGQSKPSEGIALNLVHPKPTERPGKQQPRAVVASHSREASGTLRFWDVPLDTKDKPNKPLEPFQAEYLPNPLISICFNPTHTTQLLTVSATQGARIYDYALPSLPPDPDSVGPFPVQGSWLLSLYQPFARSSATRKPILDAAWIAHGRAVFVLLADGMWGIWDIDGASPSSAGGIASKLKPGVRGAALTAFSTSGYVEGTSSLRNVVTQTKENHTGDFAPMTPHTRRQATATLSTAMTLDRLATIRGGVKVCPLPTNGNAIQDESVIFWVGGLEHVCVIPGVARFWDSQVRRGSGGGINLFSGAQPTRIVKLLDLATGLLGERCCGVGLAIDPLRHNSSTQDGGLPVDVLVLGESRIVIVREGDDGPGKKIGGVVSTRRRRLFSKGENSDAIIVHGKQERTSKMSFNLSTVKPGALRIRSTSYGQDNNNSNNTAAPVDRSHNDLFNPRPRTGFEFMDNINAAADDTADFTSRDVEIEMLDILEIDQALASMEGNRGSGRKRVLFEED